MFGCAPQVWMAISEQQGDISDLCDVDVAAARAIESVRKCEARGIPSEEGFASSFNSAENQLLFMFESVTGRCVQWISLASTFISTCAVSWKLLLVGRHAW